MNTTRHLRRIRWGLRGTLALGVAASVAANVLHAIDNPISQTIAAWPPLALLLTVEWISRVPVDRRCLAAARIAATTAIAGIAAWVSYHHMVGVAARYGETGLSPYLLPISVDGLIVVASISLVELGGHLRNTTPPANPPLTDREPEPAPGNTTPTGDGPTPVIRQTHTTRPAPAPMPAGGVLPLHGAAFTRAPNGVVR